ncbi:hypothetical protein HS1genome_0681 [Sulfodiicoccus acidiphilus]|uniref:Uncharacterized protein n=1 Tax=Sulfodiicoccus acidiphilus TaxID=1670455 RepID=A0A348B290_9CREN|nr:hypothetical protein [Sulfodiicoccus acidiphilus]BBD72292.1 hypothetical protein HS1genome_0681 [Sulfodiicoccus acidiphilus]GGT90491.1 hypothetical protein GCM10007116_05390 [Sulfodiicoccus acidiphilus]
MELAYSEEREVIPWSEVRNITLRKVREDEIRFVVEDVELAYVPIPLLPQLGEVLVLSNGAVFSEGMEIRSWRSGNKLFVPSSHSVHFYLARLFTNRRWIPVQDRGSADAEVVEEPGNLWEKWKGSCGDVPIPLKVVVSTKLDQKTLLGIKVELRRSAALAENHGRIKSVTKEMGLKGRSALECFIKLCEPFCGRAKLLLL